MSLESLYQDIILDHYKNPRGRQLLEEPMGSAFHVNPTCGDEINMQVSKDATGGLVIGYEGTGCAISQASASVLFELVQGCPAADADVIRLAFVELMHSQGHAVPDEDTLGDAVAFVGVAKYPARIKCALLPWMALQDAEIKAGFMTNDPQTKK